MNPLAATRFAANLMVAAFGIGLLVIYVTRGGIRADLVLWLGGFAILGGVAQFAASILFPHSIQPAWDEMAVASHRGAYQFGYWCAVIAFWMLFFLTQHFEMSLEAALFSLGVLLICAPSIWMAAAALRERA